MEDQTLFCEFFGYSPESKILEYLLELRDNKFTFNDIVNAIGLNRKRAYEILKNYLEKGIISHSDKVKHIQFYALNKNKEENKLLIKLFDKVIAE